MLTHRTVRVAAVQAAPVWLDTAASTDKAIALIADAAAGGAELVAFGESWLPGYPYWILTASPALGIPYWLRYFDNAVTIDGPEVTALRQSARAHGVHLALGVAERDRGTLYCTQILVDDSGEILARRRKVKPTHVERSVWGEGDGSDLRVLDTKLGRIGALSCWEHIQPLSRMAMFAQDEQLHVAGWPAFALYRQQAPDLSALAARHVCASYALEGQCFVVAASSVVPPEVATELDPMGMGLIVPGGGGSIVVSPNSTVIAEAADESADGLVFADCDLGAIRLSKMTADPTGHYARGDVTRLWFNPAPRSIVMVAEPTATSGEAGLPAPVAPPLPESASGPAPLAAAPACDET